MPAFRSGTVTAILEERTGLQRVEVDTQKAYVLTELIGTVAIGDRVVMNTTAVDLDLGTGGWHVVHWNLSRDAWESPNAGREMKLRYTSLQVEVEMADGDAALAGRPVVACFLHSQLAAVAATYKRERPDGRLVYVMTDGGALPIALSDLVAQLTGLGLLDATVTAGHAFGGDAEAVTVRSALGVAVDRFAADAIVVAMGPGSMGTGTAHGFSGIEVAAIVDATADAGGRPLVAVRYSDADPRPRHQGVSHHVRSAVAAVHATARIPVPLGETDPGLGHPVVEVDVGDIVGLLAAHGLAVTTMGRTAAEDPKFWTYAGAAGVAAADL